MKDSRFPRPVHISPRSVAWKSEEVEDWIDRLEHTHQGSRGAGIARAAAAARTLSPRRNTTSCLWRAP
ncbi:MAG: AlpA family phage regulatory protein [Gammaproteobacteria bacterium]|nr:AlpA family phage regulatory protein [Gammaproteobacteria bacterium]